MKLLQDAEWLGWSDAEMIGKRPSAPAALHRLYRMGGAFAVVIVADGDDGSGQWRTMLIGSNAAEAA